MRIALAGLDEYQVVRTYLDWVLSLPFNKRSGSEEIDLKKCRKHWTHVTKDSMKQRSASSSFSPSESCRW